MRIGHENNAIFDQWLAGETIHGIAKKTTLDKGHVLRLIEKLCASRLETMQLSESPPVYNVWPLQLL
jgi:hypothetical protein